MLSPNSLTSLSSFFLFLALLPAVAALLYFLFTAFVLWFRWRDREKKSLELVTLLVVVPQDNEVKIDANEAIISSVASFYTSAKFKFLQTFIAQLVSL